jgi:hypothetical protein
MGILPMKFVSWASRPVVAGINASLTPTPSQTHNSDSQVWHGHLAHELCVTGLPTRAYGDKASPTTAALRLTTQTQTPECGMGILPMKFVPRASRPVPAGINASLTPTPPLRLTTQTQTPPTLSDETACESHVAGFDPRACKSELSKYPRDRAVPG